ncbi:MAG TPA: metallophosphoesterase [Thermoanaerobaculia bacterium]
MRIAAVTALLLAAFLAAVALPAAFAAAPAAKAATLLAAGDIARCADLTGARATARLLARFPGVVAPLGDLAYPDGRGTDFRCFDRTWGREKRRMRPTPGNHEYHTPQAAGYFAYFGPRAGRRGEGYYSYELGTWHVIVINSNCQEIGGCQAGSPQESWLRRDLAAHPTACALAYWHHPLWSSGEKPEHARHAEMKPIWQALYDGGVEIVLNGHEHNFERFAPQDPEGRLDPEHGIREFVVGTGGKDFDPLAAPTPNSEVRRDDTVGVLKLTLASDRYAWEFVPVAGKSFSDAGEGVCHQSPVRSTQGGGVPFPPRGREGDRGVAGAIRSTP